MKRGSKMSTIKYGREMSLNETIEMFADIYFQTQNYGKSKFEIFTHLIKVFGAGSRYLFRVQNTSESKSFVAKTFAWTCALCFRLGLDAEAILWSKYPGVCPRCLQPNCKCAPPPKEIDLAVLHDIAIRNAHTKPHTVREWQVMFASIYRGPEGFKEIPPSRERLAIIFSRMLEEIGEVAEAILQDGRVDTHYKFTIENEMADVLAWVFSLANNLHFVNSSMSAISLCDIVWESYPGKCHHCGENPCVCVRGKYALELATKGAIAPTHWDQLTGLANVNGLRRYIELAQNEYIDPEGIKVWSAIFFDIDHFGQVNKKYGHDFGDTVLRILSKNALECFKNYGPVFRRGGEEFVVFMRGKGYEESRSVAENFRKILEKLKIPILIDGKNQEFSTTISGGVASTNGPKGYPPKDLEIAAETLARQAKEQGRNRILY